MTTQSISLETNINYTYDLKKYHAEDENSREEGIRKQYIRAGVTYHNLNVQNFNSIKAN